MKYQPAHPANPSVSVPSITGAQVSGVLARPQCLVAWQPSTWPVAPNAVDGPFIETLRTIFSDSILTEIHNVIDDAKARNGDLQHRGHVVAIALMCALDAISAYGYRGTGPWDKGEHIKKFVANHFPQGYRQHADAICRMYRNCLIHNWNLFEASLLPGQEPIQLMNGSVVFGLLNFFAALQEASKHFLNKLATDRSLQSNTLDLYRSLRSSARP